LLHYVEIQTREKKNVVETKKYFTGKENKIKKSK